MMMQTNIGCAITGKINKKLFTRNALQENKRSAKSQTQARTFKERAQA